MKRNIVKLVALVVTTVISLLGIYTGVALLSNPDPKPLLGAVFLVSSFLIFILSYRILPRLHKRRSEDN